MTGSNATIVKKKQKQGNIDLSQVKSSACHKKGYYANKYSEKKP